MLAHSSLHSICVKWMHWSDMGKGVFTQKRYTIQNTIEKTLFLSSQIRVVFPATGIMSPEY